MKIKALMKRNIRGTKVETMTNETYKKLSQGRVKKEIKIIKKTYSDSFSDADKYYVR